MNAIAIVAQTWALQTSSCPLLESSMDGTQALGSQVHSQLGWRSWLFWDKLGHGYRPRSTSTKAEVGLAGSTPQEATRSRNVSVEWRTHVSGMDCFQAQRTRWPFRLGWMERRDLNTSQPCLDDNAHAASGSYDDGRSKEVKADEIKGKATNAHEVRRL